jgi:hypothetical protein
MTVLHNLVAAYNRRRFACLFVSLIITMVAAPVLGAMGVRTKFMEMFLNLNILAAVLSTLFNIRTFAGVALLVLIIAARTGYALLSYAPLLETSHGIGVIVCLIAISLMLRFILSDGLVTSERIYAALDVQLLFGVMCGLLFCIFEEQWPGSFSFQGASLAGSRQNLLAHTIYFSFVTLGTLGYGDIIPVGGPARALAVTESITAQMYLVVVVARLVSLYKTSAERNNCKASDEAARAGDSPTI